MAKKAAAKKVEAKPAAKAKVDLSLADVETLSLTVQMGKLIVLGAKEDGTRINEGVELEGRKSVSLSIS